MTKNKKLIIVGGNSKLSFTLLSDKNIRSIYSSYVIFVSRQFIYNRLLFKNDRVIEYDLTSTSFTEIYDNFFYNDRDLNYSYDIIFLSTPSTNELYNDKKILEKTVNLIVAEKPSYANNSCSVYIFGSILTFLPVIGSRDYKLVKKLEYNYFLLNSKYYDNIYYLTLPPIGQVHSRLGNLFSSTEEKFGSEIFKILNNKSPNSKVKFLGSWFVKTLSRIFYILNKI